MTPERFNYDGLTKRCHGTGILICRCMGDGCCCGFHGETECLGCVDCDRGDDDLDYREDDFDPEPDDPVTGEPFIWDGKEPQP